MRLVKIRNNNGDAYINPEYVEFISPLEDGKGCKIFLRDEQWINSREDMNIVVQRLMGIGDRVELIGTVN